MQCNFKRKPADEKMNSMSKNGNYTNPIRRSIKRNEGERPSIEKLFVNVLKKIYEFSKGANIRRPAKKNRHSNMQKQATSHKKDCKDESQFVGSKECKHRLGA